MAIIKAKVGNEVQYIQGEHIVRWEPAGGGDKNTKVYTVDGKSFTLNDFMIEDFVENYGNLLKDGGTQILDLTPFQT